MYLCSTSKAFTDRPFFKLFCHVQNLVGEEPQHIWVSMLTLVGCLRGQGCWERRAGRSCCCCCSSRLENVARGLLATAAAADRRVLEGRLGLTAAAAVAGIDHVRAGHLDVVVDVGSGGDVPDLLGIRLERDQGKRGEKHPLPFY